MFVDLQMISDAFFVEEMSAGQIGAKYANVELTVA